MQRIGFFGLAGREVEWSVSDDERFSRVVQVEKLRGAVVATPVNVKFTKDVFSGDAYETFIQCMQDIVSTTSRSMMQQGYGN